jgi:hypothetical protein
MHYANPEVDQAEQAQLNSPDLATRKQAFSIIHWDVLKDLPVMYLYVAGRVSCASSTLHNFAPTGGGGTTWNVADWYLH